MKNKKRFIILLLSVLMVLSQMAIATFAEDGASDNAGQTVAGQTAESETAFDQSATVDKVKVTVKADKGVFPAGSTLKVESVDAPSSVGEDAVAKYAFDITILDKDGNELQPDGKAEVTFETAEVKKYDTEVYHMDGDEPEALEVTEKGKTATVETEGFSTYVLVFTNAEAPESSDPETPAIDYSMGSNQEVELADIVGAYKPSAHQLTGVDYAFVEWMFDDAQTASSNSNIQLFTNGTGQKCVKVKDGASFDDNTPAYINIKYKYKTKPVSSASTEWTEYTDVVRVNISVKKVDGKIIAPTPDETLVYNGENQPLFTDNGSASVGTMQYSKDNGATWESVGTAGWTSYLMEKDAGTYTVKWRVVLSNNSILEEGSETVTIEKKDATLTIKGGTRVYADDETTSIDQAVTSATFSGMVSGETPAKNVDYTLTWDAPDSGAHNVGEYTITAELTGDLWKNYDVEINPGTYKITKQPLGEIVPEVVEDFNDPEDPAEEPASYKGDFAWAYDGQKHGIVVVPHIESSDGVVLESAEIYYSQTELTEENYDTVGKKDPTQVYPTDVKTSASGTPEPYTIYYYIVAEDYESVAGSQEVQIDKALLVARVNPAATEVTYGDHVVYLNQDWETAEDAKTIVLAAYRDKDSMDEELPVVKTAISGLDQVAFDMDDKYTGDDSQAGITYTVDLANNLSSRNYEIHRIPGILRVNKKVIDFEWISVPDGRTDDFNWEYDGKEHGLKARIKADQLVGGDEGKVDFVYETDKPNDYVNEATNVNRGEDWEVLPYTTKVLKLTGERASNYTFYATKEEAEEAGEEEARNYAYDAKFSEVRESYEYLQKWFEAAAEYSEEHPQATEDEIFEYATKKADEYADGIAEEYAEENWKEYLPEYYICTSEQQFTIWPKDLTLTPDELTIPYGDDPYDTKYDQTFSNSGLVDGEEINKVLLEKPVFWYGKEFGSDGMTPYVAGDSDTGTYDIVITNVVNSDEDAAREAAYDYAIDSPEADEAYQEAYEAYMDEHPDDEAGAINAGKAAAEEYAGNFADENWEDFTHNTKDGVHAQNYHVITNEATDMLDVVKRVITNFKWKVDPSNLEYDGKYKTASAIKVKNDCEWGGEPRQITDANSVFVGLTYIKEKQINAGTYTSEVVLGTRAAKNYKFGDDTYKYTWTITKRPATVYANGNTIWYGDDPADKGYYVDNKSLVTNEETGTLDSIGTVSFKYNYAKYGKPGKYNITPVVTNLNPNYSIAAYKDGTLTVKDTRAASELVAKAIAGNKRGTVYWTPVKGAAKYQIYLSLCNTKGKKYSPKLYKTVGGNTKVYKISKLKKNTYYKFYVVALNSSGKRIAKTETHHFCTNNVCGKYTNPKSIKASKSKVTVGKGKTFKMTAKVTKAKSGKTLTNGSHTQMVRYRSGNTNVATVTQGGYIKGVGTGWCRVYVMSANGIWQTIEVTVK